MTDLSARAALRPDLVIFDCDGVLVDSEPTADRVLSANLARHGVSVSPSEVGGLFTGGTMASVAAWARAQNPNLPKDWLNEIYAETFVALRDVAPIPGIADALDQIIAAGVPIRIGSNGPQAKMAITLKSAGLWDRFGGAASGRIHSCHDHNEPKPGPELFLRAAQTEGVAPKRAVVVGDSLNDAKAARAAGMRCLGITGRVTEDQFRAHDAEPFAAMTDLPALLGL